MLIPELKPANKRLVEKYKLLLEAYAVDLNMIPEFYTPEPIDIMELRLSEIE